MIDIKRYLTAKLTTVVDSFNKSTWTKAFPISDRAIERASLPVVSRMDFPKYLNGAGGSTSRPIIVLLEMVFFVGLLQLIVAI